MRASKQPKEGERSPDSEVTERGIAPGLEVWEEREWKTCQGRTNYLRIECTTPIRSATLMAELHLNNVKTACSSLNTLCKSGGMEQVSR